MEELTMKPTLTKPLTQLADEAKTITTDKERDNFICDNFVDFMDIIFMTDKEFKEYLEENRK